MPLPHSDELFQIRNDLVVLIIGPTGSGKSTFIKYASERNDVKIGDDLRSCTDDIRFFKAKQTIGGKNVVFVDTPGFDDTSGDDVEILEKIVDFLKRIYKQKIKLAALLYMQEISDTRIGNAALSNLEVFSSLCGETAVSTITLVTTKWSLVTEEIGSRREKELKSLESPILAKATYRRFEGTFESAWEIIRERVQGRPLPALPIQKENLDEKRSVGQRRGSHKPDKTLELESVTANDVVIAVMGLTGSGKSTFIARACNKGEEYINHSIPRDIQAVETTHNNRSVVFLDTPGFDNDSTSDTLALNQVADWLNKASKAKATFSSIIYLHRITDNRMSGPSREHLEKFASLCGKKAMPNVILVTTMWELVDRETGIKREEELQKEFWAEMQADRCRTERFDNTHESAWKIISGIPASGTSLELQEDVARGDDIFMTKVFGRLRIPKWLSDLEARIRGLPRAKRH